jgi:hypothetical protein
MFYNQTTSIEKKIVYDLKTYVVLINSLVLGSSQVAVFFAILNN